METRLNRPAIYLTLAAILGVSVIFISIQAPKMQQDILSRCQDALITHRISTKGLSVDGRDVVLSGPIDSAIVSPTAHDAVEKVSGVRSITIRIASAGVSGDESAIGKPEISEFSALGQVGPGQEKEIQAKIDRVLQNQSIAFKADGTVLTPESEVALNKVAGYLSEAPALLCEIRGYDSKPAEDRVSWVQALQKALATEDYLESKGVASWRLAAAAHAVQAGESAAGRRTDRLIDLVVLSRE